MSFDLNSFRKYLKDASTHVEQDYTEPIRLRETQHQQSIREAYQRGYQQALNEQIGGGGQRPPAGGGRPGGGVGGGPTIGPDPAGTDPVGLGNYLPNYWQFLEAYFNWAGIDFGYGGNFQAWAAWAFSQGENFDWSAYGFTVAPGGGWYGGGFGDGPCWGGAACCGAGACNECGNCESWVSMWWDGTNWTINIAQQ